VATVYGAAPSTVKTYAIVIHIPSSLTCAACSMQIKSTTSWFSCATVQVLAAPAPAPGPAPTPAPAVPSAASTACSDAGNLGFCSQLKFKSVVANSTALAAATEAAVRATFDEIGATGVAVFTTQTPQCLALYSQYLCRNALPFCGEAVPCTAALCYGVAGACGLNASHAGLFPCATLAATQMATCGAQPNAAAPMWRAAALRAAATILAFASSWAIHALVY
jgi:hypothetical protein